MRNTGGLVAKWQSNIYEQDVILYFRQKWHGDGDHQSESKHLPPYAVNIFVPLTDITKANGPTE
jgi:ectoine hydroxylase-related dioxygenase (phytanoyl-CoA dioxygenase family)